MLLVLVLLVAGQLPTADEQRPGTATLRGHVTAADTGRPLRKAQIRIFAGEMRENRIATTDDAGRFEFKEVKAGRYSISATKSGYVGMFYGQNKPLDVGKPFEIKDGQTVERLDFSLTLAGVMTGRILDEFGEPLSDVSVAPMRSQFVQGKRTLVPAGRSASTDDNGEFRVYGVMPGQYYLQATWRAPNAFNMSGPEEPAYAPLFFPGVLDAGEAQRFTIEVGQQLSDLTMTLRPTKAARVSGTIVTSDGRPYAGMLNVMRTAANGMVTNNIGAMVRPDGTFQLTNLAPGDYQLRTFPNGPFGAESERASTRITVASEDITDVLLVTSKPLSVSGRLIVDAAAAQSLPPGLFVNMFPFEGGPTGPSINSPGRVGDDLNFTLKTAPGHSRIVINNLPQGWSLRAVRLNGVDIIDTGVELKANENVHGVEVELTNKTSTLTGLVSTPRGEASKDYTAIAFPQDSERWKFPNTRYIRTSRPDQDGRFKILGLPPGEYFLVAVDSIEPGEAGDPEFLERMRTKATRFSLSEGETKSIDVRVSSSS